MSVEDDSSVSPLLIFEYGLGEKIVEDSAALLDSGRSVARQVVISPDGALVAVLTPRKLCTYNYSGAAISTVALPDTLLEDADTVDTVWSACSQVVLLLSPTGSIFAYDSQCVKLLAVQSLDWMPQNALSSCLKIVPFLTSRTIAKQSNTVEIIAHVVLESGDIGTLQISAERYGVMGKSKSYKNQVVKLLNFELFSDLSRQYLSDAGFGSRERLWSVDNSSWLPRSQILLLVCKAKIPKTKGIFGGWAPFQGNVADTRTVEKLSVFALQHDHMAADKKKFNPKASSWSLLDFEPSSVECISTVPLDIDTPDGSPVCSPQSAMWSLWGNAASESGAIPTHGIRKILFDPAEEFVIILHSTGLLSVLRRDSKHGDDGDTYKTSGLRIVAQNRSVYELFSDNAHCDNASAGRVITEIHFLAANASDGFFNVLVVSQAGECTVLRLHRNETYDMISLEQNVYEIPPTLGTFISCSTCYTEDNSRTSVYSRCIVLQSIDFVSAQLFFMSVVSPQKAISLKCLQGDFDEATELAMRCGVDPDVVQLQRWSRGENVFNSSLNLSRGAECIPFHSYLNSTTHALESTLLATAEAKGRNRRIDSFRSALNGLKSVRCDRVVLEEVINVSYDLDLASPHTDDNITFWMDVLDEGIRRTNEGSFLLEKFMLSYLKGQNFTTTKNFVEHFVDTELFPMSYKVGRIDSVELVDNLTECSLFHNLSNLDTECGAVADITVDAFSLRLRNELLKSVKHVVRLRRQMLARHARLKTVQLLRASRLLVSDFTISSVTEFVLGSEIPPRRQLLHLAFFLAAKVQSKVLKEVLKLHPLTLLPSLLDILSHFPVTLDPIALVDLLPVSECVASGCTTVHVLYQNTCLADATENVECKQRPTSISPLLPLDKTALDKFIESEVLDEAKTAHVSGRIFGGGEAGDVTDYSCLSTPNEDFDIVDLTSCSRAETLCKWYIRQAMMADHYGLSPLALQWLNVAIPRCFNNHEALVNLQTAPMSSVHGGHLFDDLSEVAMLKLFTLELKIQLQHFCCLLCKDLIPPMLEFTRWVCWSPRKRIRELLFAYFGIPSTHGAESFGFEKRTVELNLPAIISYLIRPMHDGIHAMYQYMSPDRFLSSILFFALDDLLVPSVPTSLLQERMAGLKIPWDDAVDTTEWIPVLGADFLTSDCKCGTSDSYLWNCAVVEVPDETDAVEKFEIQVVQYGRLCDFNFEVSIVDAICDAIQLKVWTLPLGVVNVSAISQNDSTQTRIGSLLDACAVAEASVHTRSLTMRCLQRPVSLLCLVVRACLAYDDTSTANSLSILWKMLESTPVSSKTENPESVDIMLSEKASSEVQGLLNRKMLFKVLDAIQECLSVCDVLKKYELLTPPLSVLLDESRLTRGNTTINQLLNNAFHHSTAKARLLAKRLAHEYIASTAGLLDGLAGPEIIPASMSTAFVSDGSNSDANCIGCAHAIIVAMVFKVVESSKALLERVGNDSFSERRQGGLLIAAAIENITTASNKSELIENWVNVAADISELLSFQTTIFGDDAISKRWAGNLIVQGMFEGCCYGILSFAVSRIGLQVKADSVVKRWRDMKQSSLVTPSTADLGTLIAGMGVTRADIEALIVRKTDSLFHSATSCCDPILNEAFRCLNIFGENSSYDGHTALDDTGVESSIYLSDFDRMKAFGDLVRVCAEVGSDLIPLQMKIMKCEQLASSILSECPFAYVVADDLFGNDNEKSCENTVDGDCNSAEEDTLLLQFRLKSRPLPGNSLLDIISKAYGIADYSAYSRGRAECPVDMEEFAAYVTIKLSIVEGTLVLEPPRLDHAFRLCQHVIEHDVPILKGCDGDSLSVQRKVIKHVIDLVERIINLLKSDAMMSGSAPEFGIPNSVNLIYGRPPLQLAASLAALLLTASEDSDLVRALSVWRDISDSQLSENMWEREESVDQNISLMVTYSMHVIVNTALTTQMKASYKLLSQPLPRAASIVRLAGGGNLTSDIVGGLLMASPQCSYEDVSGKILQLSPKQFFEDTTSELLAELSSTQSNLKSTATSVRKDHSIYGSVTDEKIVKQLQAMGYSLNGSKRAVMATNNVSKQRAFEWAVLHSGDADFDEPVMVDVRSTLNQGTTKPYMGLLLSESEVKSANEVPSLQRALQYVSDISDAYFAYASDSYYTSQERSATIRSDEGSISYLTANEEILGAEKDGSSMRTDAAVEQAQKLAAAAEKAEAEHLALEQAEDERAAAEHAEAERAAAEQAETERVAAEQAEAERLATEKAEAERLALEQAEAERLAAEKAEAERLALEQAEAEMLAAEKAEAERAAAEQAEAEHVAAEQRDAERLATEKAEAERLALEQAEAERVAALQAEAERQAAEKAEAERVAAEQREAEILAAEKAEAERVAADQRDAEMLAAEKAEAERASAEQAEAEHVAAEQRDAERLATEKAEAERLALEQAEAERVAALQAEAERQAAEKAEAERVAAEQRDAEMLAAEKAEAERAAAEQAEAEHAAAEQREAERLATEKAEAERLTLEQAEAERVAAEQAEAERLVAEKAEGERAAAEQVEKERLPAVEWAEAELASVDKLKKMEGLAAAEQAEGEHFAAECAEAERLAAEQAEVGRLVAECAEMERLAAAERAEAERLAVERANVEKLKEMERLAAENVEAEALALEQAEAGRAAAKQAKAERVAAEQADYAERLVVVTEKAEDVRLVGMILDLKKSPPLRSAQKQETPSDMKNRLNVLAEASKLKSLLDVAEDYTQMGVDIDEMAKIIVLRDSDNMTQHGDEAYQYLRNVLQALSIHSEISAFELIPLLLQRLSTYFKPDFEKSNLLSKMSLDISWQNTVHADTIPAVLREVCCENDEDKGGVVADILWNIGAVRLRHAFSSQIGAAENGEPDLVAQHSPESTMNLSVTCIPILHQRPQSYFKLLFAVFEELPGEYLKRIESCKQLGVDFINKLMLHCEKSKDSTVHAKLKAIRQDLLDDVAMLKRIARVPGSRGVNAKSIIMSGDFWSRYSRADEIGFRNMRLSAIRCILESPSSFSSDIEPHEDISHVESGWFLNISGEKQIEALSLWARAVGRQLDVSVSELCFYRICQTLLSGSIESFLVSMSAIDTESDTIASIIMCLLGKMTVPQIKDMCLLIACACPIDSLAPTHFAQLPFIAEWKLCNSSLNDDECSWPVKRWKFASYYILSHLTRRHTILHPPTTDETRKKVVSLRSASKKTAQGSLEGVIPFMKEVTAFSSSILRHIPDSLHQCCIRSFYDPLSLEQLIVGMFISKDVDFTSVNFPEMHMVGLRRLAQIQTDVGININDAPASEKQSLELLHEHGLRYGARGIDLCITGGGLPDPAMDCSVSELCCESNLDERMRQLENCLCKCFSVSRDEYTMLDLIKFTLGLLSNIQMQDLLSVQHVYLCLDVLSRAAAKFDLQSKELLRQAFEKLLCYTKNVSALGLIRQGMQPIYLGFLDSATCTLYHIENESDPLFLFNMYMDHIKKMVSSKLEGPFGSLVEYLRIALSVFRVLCGRNAVHFISNALRQLAVQCVGFDTEVDREDKMPISGIVGLLSFSAQYLKTIRTTTNNDSEVKAVSDFIAEVLLVELHIGQQKSFGDEVKDLLNVCCYHLGRGYAECVRLIDVDTRADVSIDAILEVANLDTSSVPKLLLLLAILCGVSTEKIISVPRLYAWVTNEILKLWRQKIREAAGVEQRQATSVTRTNTLPIGISAECKPIILPSLLDYLDSVIKLKTERVVSHSTPNTGVGFFSTVQRSMNYGSSYPVLLSPQFFICSLVKIGEFSRASLIFWKMFLLPDKLYKPDTAVKRMMSALQSAGDIGDGSDSLLQPFLNLHTMNQSELWGWDILFSICKKSTHHPDK